MERYTASTYNKALELAETSIRGKFNVLNSREIDLSSSGITQEKLVEITVSPANDFMSEIETTSNNSMTDNVSAIRKMIREELKPINKMTLELGLLREEVNLLSRRVQNLLNPNIHEDFKRLYHSLTELGMEKLLCERLIHGYQNKLEQSVKNKSDAFRQSFNKITANIPKSEKLRKGDVVLLFGLTASGKSTIAALLQEKLSEKFDVTLRKGNSIEDFNDLTDEQITIIDFTSIQINESNSLQNLMQVSHSIKKLKKYLVIPAFTGFEDLLHFSACFTPVEPDGVIFTRMEESTQPGKLVTALLEMNLPLFGMTHCENGIIDFTDNGLELIHDRLNKNLELNADD